MRRMTVVDVDIRHRMTSCVFVLRDLDLHVQGQTLSSYALAIEKAYAADVPDIFASTRTAFAVELLLFLPSH